MIEYRDPVTGHLIRRYTEGPERNSKLYFTSENFSADDKYFFFNKRQTNGNNDGCVYRVEVATGEMTQVTDESCLGFALDREKNLAYVTRNDNEVWTVNLDDNSMRKVGELPKGGRLTSHFTAADTGRIACSYHLPNKIYSLIILDPGKACEVVYQSDYRLGHAQICPTDENLIFYIHETEGDAFQRTWMFDVPERYVRPYYVEHPNEWITHETWSADGQEMAFMKLRGKVMIGDKDGRHFDQAAESEQLLHPCLSRDRKWIVADRISYLGVTVQEGIVLIERASGKQKLIATTGSCKTGADHQHPSFNRAGDMILFNNPDENGIAQVCTIDLKQVFAEW